MSTTSQTSQVEKLSTDLLEAFDKVFGLHPGFRPVHAKGVMCSGTFKPAAEAAELTRAPHVAGPELKVLMRFSNSTGIPTIAENDPEASPRGVAVRFYMGEHVHTDIIGHSHNGFPTKTGEEFLEFIRALGDSGPDAPAPKPIETFLASHPAAYKFVETPHPNSISFATLSYFAVTAFRFINKEGTSHYGRFQIIPEAGEKFLSETEAKTKSKDYLSEEFVERLGKGAVKFRIVVEIAQSGDNVNDATATWPADRKHVEFGTVTLTKIVPNDDPDAGRVIFDPVPRVDGIEPSEDPLIELRSALYLMSGRRRRAAMQKDK